MRDISYPRYATYADVRRSPSVVHQMFFDSYVDDGRPLYPRVSRLDDLFANDSQRRTFGAAMFCGFLHDTIGVEHRVVIPSVLALHDMPFEIPAAVMKEMYKCVTDEGHHAAQALCLVEAIERQFGVETYENGEYLPLFVRRLFALRDGLATRIERSVFTMIIGVVTETRISLELGGFADDRTLSAAVRDACRQHQEDEAVHSSQFSALGKWTWEKFDSTLKALAAELYIETLVARSLPDASRISFYLSQVTGRTRQDCDAIVGERYTAEVLREEMLYAARPTLIFIRQLGMMNHPEAQAALVRHQIATDA